LTAASAAGYGLLVAGLSLGLVLGELRDELGLSGVIAALHGAMFGIGLLGVGLSGSTLLGRFGRRNTLMFSAGSMAGGVTLFCVGHSVALTLTGATAAGLGCALVVMIMPGLISDHHGEHRAAAFAAVNGVPGLVAVMFTLVVGATLQAGYSWRVAYLGLTAAIVVVLALVAWPVKLPPIDQGSAPFVLRELVKPVVLRPWLFLTLGVLTEFPVGMWAATYLKEVGGGSSAAAAACAGVFGVGMFSVRMTMPTFLRIFGDWLISVAFGGVALGVVGIVFAPGFWLRVVMLAVTGFAGGALYPLLVDRLYQSAGSEVDSSSLGAISALASGVAVTVGPLTTGVIADIVSLRWGLLFVPVLAIVGAVAQRPVVGSRSVAAVAPA
jgi:MFS transporter, CP family, cyanate transporter